MVTKRTIELSVGDYLVDEFGTEIEIFNITILEGEFTVYDLGVEDNDLYIANGVLTHNK
jgi:intein/homing endonuclease